MNSEPIETFLSPSTSSSASSFSRLVLKRWVAPLLLLAVTLCWIDSEEASRTVSSTSGVSLSKIQGKNRSVFRENEDQPWSRRGNNTASSRRSSALNTNDPSTPSRGFDVNPPIIANEITPKPSHGIYTIQGG